MKLSARAYAQHNVTASLRQAQGKPETCARYSGIGGNEDLQSAHLVEALQYRPKLIMG